MKNSEQVHKPAAQEVTEGFRNRHHVDQLARAGGKGGSTMHKPPEIRLPKFEQDALELVTDLMTWLRELHEAKPSPDFGTETLFQLGRFAERYRQILDASKARQAK